MERTIGAIDLVRSKRVRVMVKAQPHDFFLTHPVDVTVPRIRRPVLVEYDTTGGSARAGTSTAASRCPARRES